MGYKECEDCDCNDPCKSAQRYTGPDVDCLGVKNGDLLDDVLGTLMSFYCDSQDLSGGCCFSTIYQDSQELGGGSTGDNQFDIIPIGQALSGYQIAEDGDYEIEFNYNSLFFADGQLDVSLFLDGTEYNTILRRTSKKILELDPESSPIHEIEVCHLSVTGLNGLVTGQKLDVRAQATDNSNILVGNGHFVVRKVG